MGAFSVAVLGVPDVARRIARIEGEYRTAVGRVVAEYALKIEADAKRRAPVDTGFLRANVRADVTGVLVNLAANVTSGAAYSSFVEFGTVRQSAKPFLLPALEAHRAAFVRDVRAALRSAP